MHVKPEKGRKRRYLGKSYWAVIRWVEKPIKHDKMSQIKIWYRDGKTGKDYVINVSCSVPEEI